MINEETSRAELRVIREGLEGLLSRLEGLVPDELFQEAARPQEGAASDPGMEAELRTIVSRMIREVLFPLIAGLTNLVFFRAGAESVNSSATSLPLPSWGEMATLVQDLEERWNAFRDIAMNIRSTTAGGAR